MSTNPTNTDQGQKVPLKPLMMPVKVPFARTVSAQPTLGDNTGNTEGSKESSVKLNTNAPVFVPKDKRAETTPTPKTEKENTPSSVTPSPQGGFGQQLYPGMGVPPYQSKFKFNLDAPKNFAPTSYLPFTYLNAPPNMPINYQGYTPSPNRMQPSGFFPQNQMPMHGYQQFPQGYGQNLMNKYPMPAQPSTGLTNPPQATPTLPTTTLPTSDKKITFNKDSKVFIPKAMRGSTTESEADKTEKPQETQEKTETPETITEKPEEEETKPLSVEEKESTTSETEKKSDQASIEAANLAKQEEQKKIERKSKLTDFLDSEKKTVSAPKISTQNKKVVVTPTPTPVKTNDMHKTFEEKRKAFINQQKQQVTTKPLPVKKGNSEELTIEREPQKEEREQITQPKADTPIPSDEEDIEEEPKKVIERHYFLKAEGQSEQPKNIFSVDYLLSFRPWKICEEQKLLDDMLKTHLEKMSIYEDERPKGYKESKKGRRDNMSDSKFGRSSVQPPTESTSFTRSTIKLEPQANAQTDLGKWGRKDMSEAERLAQETKAKLEEYRKLDPMKNQLTEFLNILTVDNYEEVKNQIFDKVKGDVEDQKKFLEVLFKKAVTERSFVSLYAKICKELDREMPQKSEKDARQSKIRSYLVDKCREIFKTDNSKIDQYIKVTDPDEREAKLKKFLLGNVNFIAELINSKLLSKKIVFQCISNLFARIEKEDQQGLIKLINIEGIVILMDKFGTLINKYDQKIKPDELIEFNKRIDEYLNRLENLQQNDNSIPGHIRYKIINLIEKRRRGWEESKVDISNTAKGMKEVREEYENEQRSGRGPNKLDQEGVNQMVRDDLASFKEHIKSGYSEQEYHWNVIEQIFKKYKNSPAEFLHAFGENCIDLVGKQEHIHTAYVYLKEVVSFYVEGWSKREKIELVETALFFLQNLNDFCLDNNLLVDVWGSVIYLLNFYKIFSFYDLDRLKDVEEEQLKTIFEVCHIAASYDSTTRESKVKELESVAIVKANMSTFQSVFDI